MDRTIIHLDMDAFFAQVEARDNPSLVGLPVIVGSLPTDARGVVATCSYEARAYGIHSAMSIKEAYRRCPQGVYMRTNMDKYATISKQMQAICNSYTAQAEYIAFDEGFLDVTQTVDTFGGVDNLAHSIKERIKQELGLTCSVGVGYSKMSAKLASEEKKPNGYYKIETKEALQELIRHRSVRVIYGVGRQTALELEKIGIKKVKDVLNNEERVISYLKNRGREIITIAKGIDHREVTPRAERKSIGEEHTFQVDILDIEHLEEVLQEMSYRVSERLRAKKKYAKTVNIKVTYAGMRSITRSLTGLEIDDGAAIFERANRLLDKVERRPIRLVGVSVTNFTEVKQLSVFDM